METRNESNQALVRKVGDEFVFIPDGTDDQHHFTPKQVVFIEYNFNRKRLLTIFEL